MSPILKLTRDDPKRELEFELDYMASLTARQRYALMFQRSREMMERMIRHGHLNPIEIVKRPARRVRHHRRNGISNARVRARHRCIDILIKPTKENARRVLEALTQIGYDVTDSTVEEMLAKKILFRQYILATDIHPSAIGVTFETVWKNRVQDTIDDVPVFVASLDDLIKMKRAANRPKDREDLKVLRALKRRK